MRVLVLVLAVLLLPLRGWLGDGMSMAVAIEAVQQSVAISHGMQAGHDMNGMTSAASSSHADMHSSNNIHEKHSAGSGSDSDSGVQTTASASASSAHDCQSTCGNCQLCHSVAVSVWPVLVALVVAPTAPPAFAPSTFASAEPAPGFKPPIS